MPKVDWFTRQRERRDHADKAESDGRVADSMAVRAALVQRYKAGKISFAEMQAELAAIKRNAKATGQITRTQAWRGW